MRVLTVYNTKGGTAKSTLTANLGAVLARFRSKRVLLIDGDPQATLSRAFNLERPPLAGYRELVEHSDAGTLPALDQIITPTTIQGLDLVAANIPNDELKASLESSQEGYLRLRILMDLLRETSRYDVVLIDSSGTPGVISYVAAVAADLIVSPIVPDRVTIEAFFTGAARLLRDLAANPYAPYKHTRITAVIARMKRTSDSSAFRELLVQQLAPERTGGTVLSRVTVAKTEIPEAAIYPRASTAKAPVCDLDRDHGQLLLQLANELVPEAA